MSSIREFECWVDRNPSKKYAFLSENQGNSIEFPMCSVNFRFDRIKVDLYTRVIYLSSGSNRVRLSCVKSVDVLEEEVPSATLVRINCEEAGIAVSYTFVAF